MITALESYANSNGTYSVSGGGYQGNGAGWAFWEGNNYPTATSSVLISDGHLAADAIPDPYAAGDNSGTGDVLIYTCADRVAVFTRDTTTHPSASDSTWWADNNCNRYPIDRLNATYFALSRPRAG